MKPLLSAVLLLALTGCGAEALTTENLLTEQLSTEETCTETDAILSAAGGESGREERFLTASEQLGELSERASDQLEDELEVLSEILAERVEDAEALEQDSERLAELDRAVATVSETCDF